MNNHIDHCSQQRKNQIDSLSLLRAKSIWNLSDSFCSQRPACTFVPWELSHGLPADQKVPLSGKEASFWPPIRTDVEAKGWGMLVYLSFPWLSGYYHFYEESGKDEIKTEKGTTMRTRYLLWGLHAHGRTRHSVCPGSPLTKDWTQARCWPACSGFLVCAVGVRSVSGSRERATT